jgi:cytidylate kinase
MSVVIISAAPYVGGDEIADQVAQGLTYRLVGGEVLETAARERGLTPEKLATAVHEPLAWRTMSRRDRVICLAAIEATLWDFVVAGNCVCHGLAAHLYVERVSHIVRVRVEGPLERRIAAAMEQEGLSESKARKLVLGLDKQRQRWVKALYKVDESDPALFDLVIDLGLVEPGAAAARIVDLARQRRYRPMSYSRKLARDCALAAKVRAEVVMVEPGAQVTAEEGRVHIDVTTARGGGAKSAATLAARARTVEGVTEVEVSAVDDDIAQAALSMR